MSGPKKKVTNVKFVDSESLLVCSEENKANIFNFSTAKGKVTFKLEGHKAAITGCDIHPNRNLAVLASMDKTFSFYDLSQGKTLGFSSRDENPTHFSGVKFHPDGHVMALAGKDGEVKLWNLCDDSFLENI